MADISDSVDKLDRRKAFWEELADHYPLPFVRKTLKTTETVIGMVEGEGVCLDQATVLDIGCGTGVYTLPLALKASAVTGIDSSEKMIDRCEQERAARSMDNVRLLQLDWSDVDVNSPGFYRGFDIVWAAMTPAVRTAEDLARMRQCARRSCVYIGWGGLRRNELLEEIFAAHDRIFGPPPGAAAIRTMLIERGIIPHTNSIRSSWDWQGTVEEAGRNAAGHLEANGVTEVQYDRVDRILRRHFSDGIVNHTTHVELEVVTWHEK